MAFIWWVLGLAGWIFLTRGSRAGYPWPWALDREALMFWLGSLWYVSCAAIADYRQIGWAVVGVAISALVCTFRGRKPPRRRFKPATSRVKKALLARMPAPRPVPQGA